METRPHTAILTVETDLNVDFAPPKDFKETTPPPQMERNTSLGGTEETKAAEDTAPVRFGGSGQRLDGR